jgi:glycosyltransferase involved in cell wall biosynthesis
MWMRVLKQLEWPDQRGQKKVYEPGQLVDILNKYDLENLLQAGMVTHQKYSWECPPEGAPAAPFKKTKRVGIWLQTTAHYSGGRIHMFQYAWTLATLGAEVYLITNGQPRWMNDYPARENLHILIAKQDKIPVDLDLVVTDSKHDLGRRAFSWKQRHPQIPLVCFNFETPNWVAEYEPAYARRLQASKDVFKHANLLIANSELSREYALQWLGKDMKSGVVNPCVNTFGVEASDKIKGGTPAHPYAVYSARPTAYKGGDLVVRSIWDMKEPFDLVVFGDLQRKPKDTDNHKLYALKAESDAKKYALMKGAKVVLAPSKFEGYGMVPGEALAVGTPCIVYDLPVLRQAYGDALEYVKWNDPKAFKEKLKSYVGNGAVRVSSSVTNRVVKEHGMPSMAKQVEALPYHAIKRKSVSAHMICYWGFVSQAFEAIYDHVDEILVAYGPTVLNTGVAPDGSLERIQAFPDPDNKIKIEARESWKGKKEMREWCTNRITGNYHLLLDADEIWVGLDKWKEAGYPYSCPRWINLWHGPEHWIYDNAKMAGLRWGKKLKPYGSVCPHYRWSWWRASYKWRRHPCVIDANEKLLHHPNNAIVPEAVPSCVIYHLGHALPKRIMKAKHEFYRKRDGDNEGRRLREKVWHDWNGKPGNTKDGIVEAVNWKVPQIVLDAVKELGGVE